jgi:hypothetical protein
MTSPVKIVFDCSTGKEEYVPLTADEISAIEASRAESEALQAKKDAQAAAEEAARESARTKLAALGLTEAEVAALVK